MDNAVHGIRGIKCLFWDGSLLDPVKGIKIRGMSIPELKLCLPKFPGTQEAMPEGLIWLLMTGEVPTLEQALSLSKELQEKSTLPDDISEILGMCPKDLPTMSQMSIAILLLSKFSKFSKAYDEGVPKSKYWESTLDDIIDIIAKVPTIAAKVYRNVYKDGKLGPTDMSLDLTANMCKALGFDNPAMFDMMRMYLIIHSDHEGGNVSAHTAHLVSSSLADPYSVLSASFSGLSGRLHGFANREVLVWILKMKKALNNDLSEEKVTEYVHKCLESGQVIPGFGHAVLRETDPRYLCQREFALKYMKDDPIIKLVFLLYKVVPPILKNVQKIKNPWPNVDAHSGALLTHFGLVEYDFYTVLFGVSRAFGVMNQVLWARALGMPLER